MPLVVRSIPKFLTFITSADATGTNSSSQSLNSLPIVAALHHKHRKHDSNTNTNPLKLVSRVLTKDQRRFTRPKPPTLVPPPVPAHRGDTSSRLNERNIMLSAAILAPLGCVAVTPDVKEEVASSAAELLSALSHAPSLTALLELLRVAVEGDEGVGLTPSAMQSAIKRAVDIQAGAIAGGQERRAESQRGSEGGVAEYANFLLAAFRLVGVIAGGQKHASRDMHPSKMLISTAMAPFSWFPSATDALPLLRQLLGALKPVSTASDCGVLEPVYDALVPVLATAVGRAAEPPSSLVEVCTEVLDVVGHAPAPRAVWRCVEELCVLGESDAALELVNRMLSQCTFTPRCIDSAERLLSVVRTTRHRRIMKAFLRRFVDGRFAAESLGALGAAIDSGEHGSETASLLDQWKMHLLSPGESDPAAESPSSSYVTPAPSSSTEQQPKALGTTAVPSDEPGISLSRSGSVQSVVVPRAAMTSAKASVPQDHLSRIERLRAELQAAVDDFYGEDDSRAETRSLEVPSNVSTSQIVYPKPGQVSTSSPCVADGLVAKADQRDLAATAMHMPSIVPPLGVDVGSRRPTSVDAIEYVLALLTLRYAARTTPTRAPFADKSTHTTPSLLPFQPKPLEHIRVYLTHCIHVMMMDFVGPVETMASSDDPLFVGIDPTMDSILAKPRPVPGIPSSYTVASSVQQVEFLKPPLKAADNTTILLLLRGLELSADTASANILITRFIRAALWVRANAQRFRKSAVTPFSISAIHFQRAMLAVSSDCKSGLDNVLTLHRALLELHNQHSDHEREKMERRHELRYLLGQAKKGVETARDDAEEDDFLASVARQESVKKMTKELSELGPKLSQFCPNLRMASLVIAAAGRHFVPSIYKAIPIADVNRTRDAFIQKVISSYVDAGLSISTTSLRCFAARAACAAGDQYSSLRWMELVYSSSFADSTEAFRGATWARIITSCLRPSVHKDTITAVVDALVHCPDASLVCRRDDVIVALLRIAASSCYNLVNVTSLLPNPLRMSHHYGLALFAAYKGIVTSSSGPADSSSSSVANTVEFATCIMNDLTEGLRMGCVHETVGFEAVLQPAASILSFLGCTESVAKPLVNSFLTLFAEVLTHTSVLMISASAALTVGNSMVHHHSIQGIHTFLHSLQSGQILIDIPPDSWINYPRIRAFALSVCGLLLPRRRPLRNEITPVFAVEILERVFRCDLSAVSVAMGAFCTTFVPFTANPADTTAQSDEIATLKADNHLVYDTALIALLRGGRYQAQQCIEFMAASKGSVRGANGTLSLLAMAVCVHIIPSLAFSSIAMVLVKNIEGHLSLTQLLPQSNETLEQRLASGLCDISPTATANEVFRDILDQGGCTLQLSCQLCSDEAGTDPPARFPALLSDPFVSVIERHGGDDTTCKDVVLVVKFYMRIATDYLRRAADESHYAVDAAEIHRVVSVIHTICRCVIASLLSTARYSVAWATLARPVVEFDASVRYASEALEVLDSLPFVLNAELTVLALQSLFPDKDAAKHLGAHDVLDILDEAAVRAHIGLEDRCISSPAFLEENTGEQLEHTDYFLDHEEGLVPTYSSRVNFGLLRPSGSHSEPSRGRNDHHQRKRKRQAYPPNDSTPSSSSGAENSFAEPLSKEDLLRLQAEAAASLEVLDRMLAAYNTTDASAESGKESSAESQRADDDEDIFPPDGTVELSPYHLANLQDALADLRNDQFGESQRDDAILRELDKYFSQEYLKDHDADPSAPTEGTDAETSTPQSSSTNPSSDDGSASTTDIADIEPEAVNDEATLTALASTLRDELQHFHTEDFLSWRSESAKQIAEKLKTEHEKD